MNHPTHIKTILLSQENLGFDEEHLGFDVDIVDVLVADWDTTQPEKILWLDYPKMTMKFHAIR